MKRLNLYLLFAISFIAIEKTFAQDTAKSHPVDQLPAFPGGLESFYKFVNKTLRYPDVAKLVGLSGKVKVSFVIDTDGTVTHVLPVKSLGAGCTEEAIRVVSMSPKWQPGYRNGERVRLSYTMPIDFTFNA